MTENAFTDEQIEAGILRARYRCTSRTETLNFWKCIFTPAPFDQLRGSLIYKENEFKFCFEKCDPLVPEVGKYYLVEASGKKMEFIELN